VAEFADKVLKCVDCGADFIFTAGEQAFFAEKNFKNDPKRCKDCKAKVKQKRQAVPGLAGQEGVESTIICTNCGREAKVPFKPAEGRPVYCHDCFQQRRSPSAASSGPL
jgi:CxxC-x17-CxxC domain-containing protein